jgi:hypothetical protein
MELQAYEKEIFRHRILQILNTLYTEKGKIKYDDICHFGINIFGSFLLTSKLP